MFFWGEFEGDREGAFGGCTAALSGMWSLLLMVDEEVLVRKPAGFASCASLYRIFRCLQFLIGERCFEGEDVPGGVLVGGVISASSKAEIAASVSASASIKALFISEHSII